jgi:NAD+ synthase (glutamine-hydrolysing)
VDPVSCNMSSRVNIRLVQMEVLPGRPVENTEKILNRITEARAAGRTLVVFPEMAVPGYLLGDEWERPAFLRECEACGEEIRAASTGITVMFGNVGIDWSRRNEDGRVRKYNALFIAENGRFLGPEDGLYPFVIKTLMPNYREFDDSRHFFDTRKLAAELGRDPRDLIAPVQTACGRIGAVLCEDAWDQDYTVSPLKILGGKGVDFAVNASCSPFTFNKNNKRNRVFSEAARRLQRPLVYVNNVGIQNNGKTVFTFDGASCIYDGQGSPVETLAPFTEGVMDSTLGESLPFEVGRDLPATAGSDASLFDAILYGTKQFMKACGVERVVVGVSGGIDSAVVAALYRHILPADRLLLVNMPSRFNSPTTINLARELAKNLGCGYVEIPIEDSVKLTRVQVAGVDVRWPDGVKRLALTDFQLENVQARDRSSRVLAAVASSFGGVFTCNANKSEMTVGYTTLYGDLGGYLANLADLWKGEVYELGRYLNETVFRRAVIPEGSFAVVPSAELSVAQAVDEGKGDPLIYPYHDKLFRSWVEDWNRSTPEEILEWYGEGTLEQHLDYAGCVKDLFPSPKHFIDDLERWWNHYQGMGVAKRIQAPPVLAVKRRAFGFDHRESQMGPRYTRRYEELKKQLIG